MFGRLSSWPQMLRIGPEESSEFLLTSYSHMYDLGNDFVSTESGSVPFCNGIDGIFGLGPPWGGANLYQNVPCNESSSQTTYPSPWYNDFFAMRHPRRFSIAMNGEILQTEGVSGLMRWGEQVRVPREKATFEIVRPPFAFTRGLSSYYIQNASGQYFLMDTGFESTNGRLGPPIVDFAGHEQPFMLPVCEGDICSPGTIQFRVTCVIFELDASLIHLTAISNCM